MAEDTDGTLADETVTFTAARELEYERAPTLAADRVVQDLHDTVIQQLFAAGIGLQGAIANSPSADVTERLHQTVDDLQAIVNEIRNTINRLQLPD